MTTATLEARKRSGTEASLSEMHRLLHMDKKALAAILAVSDRNLARWLDEPSLAEDNYRFQLLREICVKSRGIIKPDQLGGWLTRPHAELGNYKPVSLMLDLQGFKDVLKLLESYKGGTYA